MAIPTNYTRVAMARDVWSSGGRCVCITWERVDTRIERFRGYGRSAEGDLWACGRPAVMTTAIALFTYIYL